ncbi:hypothetical protein LMH87_006234 [Akanthomyces muscarius]|uniref:Uncharacterized protein n=1 Tax=Akanthomyces muscarius TaxID=2231603 RepID=A0A9W8QNF2_AKAMU|nr:hypothetical protein LMH87_006234 [Akanthomyces muscarius]KAJ4164565.1 hypothetical protein LMH87_006234 [Akanthomyces muscarius]
MLITQDSSCYIVGFSSWHPQTLTKWTERFGLASPRWSGTHSSRLDSSARKEDRKRCSSETHLLPAT